MMIAVSTHPVVSDEFLLENHLATAFALVPQVVGGIPRIQYFLQLRFDIIGKPTHAMYPLLLSRDLNLANDLILHHLRAIG